MFPHTPAYRALCSREVQSSVTMSEYQVDIELLITLIEARPVLWDKSSDIYKDRDGTRKAWKEVCEGLKEDFGELSDSEKNVFGK